MRTGRWLSERPAELEVAAMATAVKEVVVVVEAVLEVGVVADSEAAARVEPTAEHAWCTRLHTNSRQSCPPSGSAQE